MTEPLVIVGGGVATVGAVKAIRRAGHDGSIVVVGSEAHHPYERPSLSKDYLRGETTRLSAFTLSPGWYAENGVSVRSATTAVGLDADAHRLTLSDGSVQTYSRLLLATGSTPRAADIPGEDLEGVLSLRTLENADLLRTSIQAARAGGQRLVIIGDGWIGLEVAASARALGLDVDVLGHSGQPLAKVLGTKMGGFFAEVHAQHGVSLHRQARATRIDAVDGRVSGVTLASGEQIPAGLVLIAVGATPNVGLAASAGARVRAGAAGGGIEVDGTLATTLPDVFAAGDIAAIPSPRYGRLLRVEHWAQGLRTGTHAGKALLGADAAYDRLPYFYSDQFDLSMEYSGYVADPDATATVHVSGSPSKRSFVTFWTIDDRVVAGMTVNTPGRIGEIERLIAADKPVAESKLMGFHASALA